MHMFPSASAQLPGPGFVLAPHLYPGSITTDYNATTQNPANIAARWDLSWGLKAQGRDTDAQVNWHQRQHSEVSKGIACSFGCGHELNWMKSVNSSSMHSATSSRRLVGQACSRCGSDL
eukprot:GHUV01046171.1.p1 GENE.GHUV01046171.1~~GHUV01046171.1.p1  ORF type:complete len:119 (+),score=6.08 GHUV01046171.1:390-746(+)